MLDFSSSQAPRLFILALEALSKPSSTALVSVAPSHGWLRPWLCSILSLATDGFVPAQPQALSAAPSPLVAPPSPAPVSAASSHRPRKASVSCSASDPLPSGSDLIPSASDLLGLGPASLGSRTIPDSALALYGPRLRCQLPSASEGLCLLLGLGPAPLGLGPTRPRASSPQLLDCSRLCLGLVRPPSPDPASSKPRLTEATPLGSQTIPDSASALYGLRPHLPSPLPAPIGFGRPPSPAQPQTRSPRPRLPLGLEPAPLGLGPSRPRTSSPWLSNRFQLCLGLVRPPSLALVSAASSRRPRKASVSYSASDLLGLGPALLDLEPAPLGSRTVPDSTSAL